MRRRRRRPAQSAPGSCSLDRRRAFEPLPPAHRSQQLSHVSGAPQGANKGAQRVACSGARLSGAALAPACQEQPGDQCPQRVAWRRRPPWPRRRWQAPPPPPPMLPPPVLPPPDSRPRWSSWWSFARTWRPSRRAMLSRAPRRSTALVDCRPGLIFGPRPATGGCTVRRRRRRSPVLQLAVPAQGFYRCTQWLPAAAAGITVPIAQGGLGLGRLHHAIAMEEMCRASGAGKGCCGRWLKTAVGRAFGALQGLPNPRPQPAATPPAAVGASWGVHTAVVISQLVHHGTRQQLDKFLPQLVSGGWSDALRPLLRQPAPKPPPAAPRRRPRLLLIAAARAAACRRACGRAGCVRAQRRLRCCQHALPGRWAGAPAGTRAAVPCKHRSGAACRRPAGWLPASAHCGVPLQTRGTVATC